MVIRVFQARIFPEHREEFERKFQDISIRTVSGQPGFRSATIGKPTQWSPDEYLMVSIWENEAALQTWLGPEWNRAHIPAGMERLIRECRVHHYESFSST